MSRFSKRALFEAELQGLFQALKVREGEAEVEVFSELKIPFKSFNRETIK